MTCELVSVVMPAYNSAKYIRESVDSVLRQEYRNLELVIADDASNDDTLALVQEMARNDVRITVLPSESNQGAGATRNRAIQATRGRYLAFLDADDVWAPNKLQRQISFMQENTYAFTFTSYRMCTEWGAETETVVDVRCPDEVGYHDMLAKRATIGCSTVVLDREMVGPVEMPLVRSGQDYALWLQLLKRGLRAHRFPEILTSYRVVPGSVSRNKIKKARRQWQIYREIENLPFAPSVWYFMNYAYRAVFRR